MLRRSLFRRASYGLTGALTLVVLACSGSGDATGPDPIDPGPGPVDPGPGPVDPGPGPGPVDPGPGPVDPGPGPTEPGIIAGTYVLTAINGSEPGLMVSLANPDGNLIGIYRFQPTTTLVLDPMGGYSLSLEYSDDKGNYVLGDEGEYKWTGAEGGVLLSFDSETWGDAFNGAVADDRSAAIDYDFDGDRRADTRFEFQQVGG
jgi:hypothetical protein